jgi:hypothetical protein
MPASGQIPDLPDDASSNAISGPSSIGSTPGPSNASSNAIIQFEFEYDNYSLIGPNFFSCNIMQGK